MNRRMVTPTQPDPPEVGCMVCGRARLHLAIDTRRPLSVLVSQVGRRPLRCIAQPAGHSLSGAGASGGACHQGLAAPEPHSRDGLLVAAVLQPETPGWDGAATGVSTVPPGHGPRSGCKLSRPLVPKGRAWRRSAIRLSQAAQLAGDPPPPAICSAQAGGSAQVLKGQLALLEPCISAAGFLYEEGEGLEPDELADQAARLGRALRELPGGGLGHGTVADISDQSQSLSFQLHIAHQVRPAASDTRLTACHGAAISCLGLVRACRSCSHCWSPCGDNAAVTRHHLAAGGVERGDASHAVSAVRQQATSRRCSCVCRRWAACLPRAHMCAASSRAGPVDAQVPAASSCAWLRSACRCSQLRLHVSRCFGSCCCRRRPGPAGRRRGRHHHRPSTGGGCSCQGQAPGWRSSGRSRGCPPGTCQQTGKAAKRSLMAVL